MISGKAFSLWVLTISLFAISCTFHEQPKEAVREIKTKAFDSTFNISKLGLPIDTLEVIYMQYACDCPQWLEDSVHKRYYGEGKYELPAVGYYLEPSSSKYAIEPDLCLALNKFRVIGYQRSAFGLPNTGEFMTDHPPKGRVFVYFKWEVIKPYSLLIDGERKVFN
jgi:hypothetical protein